jgi:hypothetical protein
MKSKITVQLVISLLVLSSLLGTPSRGSEVNAIPQTPLAPANNWNALVGGVSGDVFEIIVDGPYVYVGGSFTTAGATTVNNVARWDSRNNTWEALGSGTVGVGGPVYALQMVGTNLYVGGDFPSAGSNSATNFAHWDSLTNTWTTDGSALNAPVYALASYSKDVWLGGAFTNVTTWTDTEPNPNADYLVRWDGTYFFDETGDSPFNDPVFTIKIVGDIAYVGGGFDNYSYIAKREGGNWSSIGGLNSDVYDIEVVGTSIFATGVFTNVGGVSACNSIARWNGTNWLPVACGISGGTFVSDIVVVGMDLYAGGEFTIGGSIYNIAQWNGSAWQALGSGVNSSGKIGASALWLEGSRLYLGGSFENGGGNTSADHVAYWDISESDPEWNPVSGGLNGEVEAMVIVGTDIYVGGWFTAAGGIDEADYIARWDGHQWNALGPGLNGTVYAIKVIGTDVYVGGSFTNFIARWDMIDKTWYPLNGSLNGPVYALEKLDADLVAGGSFTSATDYVGEPVDSTEHIALYNGSWADAGYGLNATVYTLKSTSKFVYVGGSFTYEEEGSYPQANYIACYDWNNYSWSAVGNYDSLNGTVYDIDVAGGYVYAGGEFTDLTGDKDHIARFNLADSTWYSVVEGLNNTVDAVKVIGPNVYVGGDFASPVYHVGYWDGTSWTTLGSGLLNSVNTIAQIGTQLYVGGSFNNAGGYEDGDKIARWGTVYSFASTYLPLVKKP